MGSSLNAIVSTKVSALYKDGNHEGEFLNVGMPMLIGLGFMVASLLLALLLSYYDRRT